jgi:hypothetical protein
LWKKEMLQEIQERKTLQKMSGKTEDGVI